MRKIGAYVMQVGKLGSIIILVAAGLAVDKDLRVTGGIQSGPAIGKYLIQRPSDDYGIVDKIDADGGDRQLIGNNLVGVEAEVEVRMPFEVPAFDITGIDSQVEAMALDAGIITRIRQPSRRSIGGNRPDQVYPFFKIEVEAAADAPVPGR